MKSLLSFSSGPVCSYIFFFEENGIAEIGEGDSKDSLARDDDAHKAFVST